MVDFEHRGLCREIALPTSGVERARITNEGDFFWSLDPMFTSAAEKLKAIGISPDFLSSDAAGNTKDLLKAFEEHLEELCEDYDALESGSLSLEEMEKHWAEADAAQGVTMTRTRQHKHLSSR